MGKKKRPNFIRSYTLFNKFFESEDYNIDYKYYISEANKIKNAVEDFQLELF